MIPLVNTFDNTYVLIGPYQAPLFYLSSGQLDILLPAELDPTQQYPIVVSVNNAVTLPDTLNIVPATPGVAAFAEWRNHCAAHRLLAGDRRQSREAGRSDHYVPGGSGCDQTERGFRQPAPSTPPLAEVVLPVTVTVNEPKAVVDFAGLTPGSAGFYQIDFQVPTNAPNGNLNVVVTQNGVMSNTTTLPVSN